MEMMDPSVLYCLFKGDPGSRKSTQALTFPTPQFWFSWDRKMSGLMVPMKKWGINPSLIEYEDYKDWTAPRARLEQLQVNCKYKTLIFDSITSMADMTLRQTLDVKRGKTRASGAKAGMSVGGIVVNEMEDYNAEAAALNELIALTKDIGNYHKVNIILIAHVIQAEYKTPGGVTNFSRTIVTAGKRVAPKIPAYCGEVYHFGIKKGFVEGAGGTYHLFTEHTGDDFARSALDLPNEIEFGEQQLYNNWLKPAIDKLKPENGNNQEPPKPMGFQK